MVNYPKILFVCTVPALESYSSGVVRTALASASFDAYAYIFQSGDDGRSELVFLEDIGVSDNYRTKVAVDRLASNKISRIISGRRYLSRVLKYALAHKINIVHFISQDVMLYSNLKLFRNFEVCYTVHDLEPHEVKLSLLQQLKHYYFRIRKDQWLIRNINCLVTNSRHQQQLLNCKYPRKRIYYHHMPGLVTPSVSNGKSILPEIERHENYVLFFGRIEWYKGVDLLYRSFIEDKDLLNYKLVIAGKGNIYFERIPELEQNIIFINRYIKDDELSYLFSRARLLVLPYRSATQSAVVSIAYHFHLPVIASNIGGLSDNIAHMRTGLLIDSNTPETLSVAIQQMFKDSSQYEEMKAFIKQGVQSFNPEQLHRELSAIYCSF